MTLQNEQVVENAVEEYMALMNRIDSLMEEINKEKVHAEPEKEQELNERMDDIKAIRDQLINTVKESGISRDILDQANRLLSIF